MYHHKGQRQRLQTGNRDEEQNFQKVLYDNNAVLKSVKLNDHNALGIILIIDTFAKNLKSVLTKEFIESGSTNWTPGLCPGLTSWTQS